MGAPGPAAGCLRGEIAPGRPGRGRQLLCVEHQSPEVGGPQAFVDARPGSHRVPLQALPSSRQQSLCCSQGAGGLSPGWPGSGELS